MRALYTFNISSLMDASTTWGATNHQVPCGELLHHLQLPRRAITDVSSHLILQQHLLWSSGYLGYLAFTITGNVNFLALGVKKGPGERGRGHGEERGQEGQAGVRNYEEFLILLYSTRKLSTATNQFPCLV